MTSLIKTSTSLAVTSIILSLAFWTVICYSFVLNSIELMSLGISISKLSEAEAEQLNAMLIASFVVSHLIQMACEVFMIGLLVVEFLSSFDYLTGDGQEFRKTWKDCHRKIFAVNTIVLVISLCLFLGSMNLCYIYELSVITINFLFLLTVISLEVKGVDGLSQERGGFNLKADGIAKADKNCDSGIENKSESDHKINICSFLENKRVQCFENPNYVV